MQIILDRIKEEEERKKREEEERLRKIREAEEEKKRQKEERRKKIRILFEKNIKTYENIEILRRRFIQYKLGVENEIKYQENQKRILRLKRKEEEE